MQSKSAIGISKGEVPAEAGVSLFKMPKLLFLFFYNRDTQWYLVSW